MQGLDPPGWPIFLSGSTRDEAFDTVERLATALEIRIVQDLNAPRTSPEKLAPWLANGLSGIALFFAYLYLHKREERYKGIATAVLVKAVEELSHSQLPLGLLFGATGVSWAGPRSRCAPAWRITSTRV